MSANNRIVFYDSQFPFAGARPDKEQADQFSILSRVVNADGLAEALAAAAGGTFITMHGSYFPKEAWPAILAFLRKGGGLLCAGGAPFTRPCNGSGQNWSAETEQTAYLQQLHIHEAMKVDGSKVEALAASEAIPLLAGSECLFAMGDTSSLILHVTKTNDMPHESGTAGPMDAHIYPLLIGLCEEGRERSAPVVSLEFTKGEFAGGRWIFVNQPVQSAWWEKQGAELFVRMADHCALGVTEIWLKPNYAAYDPGDRAKLSLQMQRLTRLSAVGQPSSRWTFDIAVSKRETAKGEPVWSGRLELEAGNDLLLKTIPLPFDVQKGLYDVICAAESDGGEKRLLKQSFWGMDEELLAAGSPLTCGRDYFERDGKPLPIVGMTYMTSDVARKFLFLPNVHVWERDMAQMKKAGINLIRTGIWTAHRHFMYADGHASEETLRAIDAFFLTAKRHGLEVTFNFFAFTPEAWEGVNPYLDPRSVEAQKRFIAAIVQRHRRSYHVHWDLINEPSMFDPKRVFAGPRSSQDRFERAAFAEWLKERHGTVETLQERWNMTPEELPGFAAAGLPEQSEINFDVQDMTQGKKGNRWLDYSLFTMDMHNRWAAGLRSAIKTTNPDQLVTVGQDEALAGKRPSPFLYAESVDYTTVHSWWMMDQLVWDGIFAKAPDKPNLVQETGIMYVETPDGRAKRSELELRNILERKYAYAFSTGGAGAVQWIWNTNFYMHNVNESNIGALRADGTEKPEADVSYDFGAFMEAVGDLFVDRQLEEVAAVFPYSNDLSNRPLAFDATSRLTRTLAYDMNVPHRAFGEYHLEALLTDAPKLLVVPSAHNLSDAALEKMLTAVREQGVTLLVTGPLGLNEYWRPVSRLAELRGEWTIANVLREDMVEIGGKRYPVSFGGRRIAEACKETAASTGGKPGAAGVIDFGYGNGRILWCPLPLELNERNEPLIALYTYALEAADVRKELEWRKGGELPGIYGRKLAFKSGALYLFVSEYAYDTEIEIADPVTGTVYAFTLESERSVMFAADGDGRMLAVYRPHEVAVSVSSGN
ncbi:beta-galactosidase [Paenibacillus sp. MBLB4367]|uniref:beta-galactosidase n=1 Tax=Paenibacillus sp. MBLB4367 TaxID=3384767 RepID=UPI003907ECDC